MKLLFIIILLASSPLAAQNYYVSIIKGKVTYNGKPVKLRSKIKRTGELRFSTKEDYIKVSGPGGIYTLRPEKPTAGGTEFFTALRDELFPAYRPRSTVAAGMVYDPSQPFWFAGQEGGLRWEGEGPQLHAELLEKADQLFFLLALEDSTVISLPATIKKGKLVFWSETFAGYSIARAGIMFVNDTEAWPARVAAAKTFKEVPMISHTELIPRDTVIEDGVMDMFNLIDYERFAMGDYEQDDANILLGYLYPSYLINRKELYKDLRRQVKWIKPESSRGLLDNNEFEDYLSERYNLDGLPYSAMPYLRKLLKEEQE